MREAHARTRPGEKVWGGLTWALHREPAYRFWFLPDLARYLVIHGYAEPWRVRDLIADPPALLVFDHYALVWLVTVQRDIAPYLIRHYVPVWRNLWVPGMNVRLRPGGRIEWIVPRDGVYRFHASPALARHFWFRDPLGFVSYKKDDADRFTVELPQPELRPDVRWWIDGKPVAPTSPSIPLRRGQRVAIASAASEPLGVILLGSDDRRVFRQPPSGATLEAETTRVTHVPDIGAELPR